MQILFLLSIVSLFLVGCTTTKQPSAMNNLEIKIAQLEHKLDEKDQEINDLKYEVEELSNQMSNKELSETVKDSQEDVSRSGSSKSSSSDTEQIIKVDASAKDVQSALKKAGYYNGPIDGKAGKNTKKAVAEFQKDHNLNGDGIVGKKTWMELKNYLK